jgi:antitoxin (DNA-binding transcriptional repressor) of toxin-antitoxin stability system
VECSLAGRRQLQYFREVKTLTVTEAVRDLAALLKQAAAGEEISIRSEDTIVVLQPLRSNGSAKTLAPRDALRQLQSTARLSSTEAEKYLREVRAERLAAEKHSA